MPSANTEAASDQQLPLSTQTLLLLLSSVHYSSNRPPHSLTFTHAGVIIFYNFQCFAVFALHLGPHRQTATAVKQAGSNHKVAIFFPLTSLAVHAAASAAALCCHTHTTATATVSFCLSFSFLSFHPLHSFYQESEWKDRHWRQLPERQSAIDVLCSRHAVSFSFSFSFFRQLLRFRLLSLETWKHRRRHNIHTHLESLKSKKRNWKAKVKVKVKIKVSVCT